MKTAGAGEGSRVLVFEDATADWPCSLLAIMRIGAVYIPLDLRNPLPRLADVAVSCQPAVILVDDSTVGDAPQVNFADAKVLNISSVDSKPSARVPNSARADSVGAILYTSGSTGKPKGIVVKHSGLRNEIEGHTIQWGLKAERVLQQSAFTFNHSLIKSILDLSMEALFISYHGASAEILSRSLKLFKKKALRI